MTMVAEPKKAKKPKVDVEVFGNDDATLDLKSDQVPPPKPGEVGYDWADQYPDEKFMVYTAKSGVTVGLAAMTEDRKPTMGELKRILQKDQLSQMFETVERITSPAALEIAEGFKEPDYTAMLDEWTEWSQTTLGES